MAKRKKKPKLDVVRLAELLPDEHNPMKHPDRNRRAIRESLERFGGARSLVMDGQGVVRAGNGTLEGALEEGFEEAVVVETDGSQLVIVKRPDWTEEEALAYAVADNRIAQLAEWDFPELAAALKAIVDRAPGLRGIGFEDFEVEPMLGANWLGDGDEDLEGFQAPEPALSIRLAGAFLELFELTRKALGMEEAKPEAVVEELCRRATS